MCYCFSNRQTIHDYINIIIHIRDIGNMVYPKKVRCLRSFCVDAIYISSTQAIVRQMRAQIGRSVSPSYTDHLLPTCNYGRFHQTLKSVARSWQYVCYTRVACKSRSLILYLDIIQNLRLR